MEENPGLAEVAAGRADGQADGFVHSASLSGRAISRFGRASLRLCQSSSSRRGTGGHAFAENRAWTALARFL
jgi:hypothetical protein